MGYDRRKVIRIATQETGYLEKSAAAYKKDPGILDQKTAGAGYDNYTKYGRDMHRVYPSVMDFPAPWCDLFVDWCFYKAYGAATAKSLLDGNFDDYTVASAEMYAKHNALDKKPEVGSQIFFTKNGKASGCYHTGLVVAVAADGKTVTTIEGNTSAIGTNIEPNGGCVARKTRAVTSSTLFGHPAYNDGYGTRQTSSSNSQTTQDTSTTLPYNAAKHFSRSEAGAYIVSTQKDPLMMRADAGTNFKILYRVPKGAMVQCYGYYQLQKGTTIKWLLCDYNGNKGYLYRELLRRIQE